MTLYIAETNDRVRQRLASIAASVEGLAVVGEAGEVGNAVEGIKRAKPDSVIVALPMSGGSGIDVLSAAKSIDPTPVAIILTQSPCKECERKCFAMGADYFFEKSSEMKRLVTTLVLLAHQPPRQKTEVWPETIPGSVPSVLNPPEEWGLNSSGVPENCPRMGAFHPANRTICFLAGSPGRTPAMIGH